MATKALSRSRKAKPTKPTGKAKPATPRQKRRNPADRDGRVFYTVREFHRRLSRGGCHHGGNSPTAFGSVEAAQEYADRDRSYLGKFFEQVHIIEQVDFMPDSAEARFFLLEVRPHTTEGRCPSRPQSPLNFPRNPEKYYFRRKDHHPVDRDSGLKEMARRNGDKGESAWWVLIECGQPIRESYDSPDIEWTGVGTMRMSEYFPVRFAIPTPAEIEAITVDKPKGGAR